MTRREPIMDNLNRAPITARVLCIDDDAAITEGMRIRLRAQGYEVLTAGNGDDGMKLAIEAQPDVIITDMWMPQTGGEYLVECLLGRTDTCDIPIIVLTGRRDPELERFMLTLGARHYLCKPPRPDSLLSALADCLQRQPAPDRTLALALPEA
jgi:DNA-binding response OmpR family regulator